MQLKSMLVEIVHMYEYLYDTIVNLLAPEFYI
jgi:hypothetical protein